MDLRVLTDRAFRRSRNYCLPEAPQSPNGQNGHYLTTATIVRNESRFLREFVLFHRAVGVEHMLIYDDGSTDNILEVLAPFISTGFVSLVPWPRFVLGRNNQFLAYQHAIASQLGKTFWLAMIDADEFLFSPNGDDLKHHLRACETYSAIGVYSHTFGTSGLTELNPERPLTLQLTKSAQGDYLKNCTHRSIVQPHAVAAIRSANSCVLKGTQRIGWDETGQPINRTGETGHSRKKLRINHYFSRAHGDFKRKISRDYFGSSNWSSKMQGKLLELHALDQLATQDDGIKLWIDRIEKLL